MPAVAVHNLHKSYAGKPAVQDLSFCLDPGEILGLIGPNGAGKTSTIRMMMDIIQPDSGRVTIFGQPPSEAIKAKLGYLPEERGLYKKLTVIETLTYLASLKGMDARSIQARADALLDQTGMLPHKKKRIEELSKGMAQIIQLVVTVLHDPDVVVLDEPFAGLDPVNTERVKQLLVDLRDQGKAVILSTHQMNQVEAVCDRILMVHNGRSVLYGALEAIRSEHRGHSVLVEADGDIGPVPGVAKMRTHKDHTELVLDAESTPQQVLKELVTAGILMDRFEVATPSLNEIFLQVVGGNHE
jgi:ABC-2 type transport system ATP-binding protein